LWTYECAGASISLRRDSSSIQLRAPSENHLPPNGASAIRGNGIEQRRRQVCARKQLTTRCVRRANRPSGGRWRMPTTRQHPCRAAPPAPRRSRRSRYPSGNRQQRLDRLRPAHVGRQDRRREPDAVGIGGVRLAIAHERNVRKVLFISLNNRAEVLL
jgi:hypothetical protein